MTESPARRVGVELPMFSDLVRRGDKSFRLHTSVYHDERVFEAEMAEIFESSWVYVCHESQVKEPGSFTTTSIGRQPILVSRGDDGKIRVFLNVCRHRGSTLCRESSGSERTFRCPYHGWIYSNTGTLIGIPQRKEGYPDGFGQDFRLLEAATVESYRGLVFASLVGSVPSLIEWLSGVAHYIELWADRAPNGEITTIDPPHAYSYPGSWKLQAENGTDGYHGNYVHESWWNLLETAGEHRVSQVQAFREGGCSRAFPNGHALLERPPRLGKAIELTDEADPSSDYLRRLHSAYGEERAEQVLMQRNIFVFPNVFLFDRSIRVIQPRTSESTDVRAYYFELGGVSTEFNRLRLSEHQRFFSTAGFGVPDDLEIFAAVASGTRARGLEWLVFDRGMTSEEVHPDGERVGHSTAEIPQRAFYDQWRAMMCDADPT
jgi:benzoate/toluate 1,2-dioxygenase alpha subunit